jgi:hypothetical protein
MELALKSELPKCQGTREFERRTKQRRQMSVEEKIPM